MHQHALVIDPGWLIWDTEEVIVDETTRYELAEGLRILLNTIKSKNIKIYISQEIIFELYASYPWGKRNPLFMDLKVKLNSIFSKERDILIEPEILENIDVKIVPNIHRIYFSEQLTDAITLFVSAMHQNHKENWKLSLISHSAIWSHLGHATTDDGATQKTYPTHARSGTEPEIADFLNTVKNTFEHNPKHGLVTYYQNGNLVSPLLTPHGRAETLLQQAIGENRHADEELFAYDDEIARFIVFKQTHPGKSVYHAYNPEAPDEVPSAIWARLIH